MQVSVIILDIWKGSVPWEERDGTALTGLATWRFQKLGTKSLLLILLVLVQPPGLLSEQKISKILLNT